VISPVSVSLLELMISVHWLKQTFGCGRRDLILTRECGRSSQGVGGGQISGAIGAPDPWAWFIRTIFSFFKRKSPLESITSLRAFNRGDT
jgi:hypothetical protein